MTAAGLDGFSGELRRVIAAGFPIVIVATHEEARALAMLRAVASKAPMPVWRVTRGFDSSGEPREPVAGVQAAIDSKGPGVHVYLDLHPFFRQPEVVRVLRDFAAIASDERKCVVLIMPKPEIPVEIEKDVAILDLPLPTPDEIRMVLDAELTSAGGSPAWDLDAAVRAARGLTWAEAQRAFRLARSYGDPQQGLRRIVAEKRRVLRQSATIELVESGVNVDDVGGLEVLKGWLRSRVPAFGEDARRFGLPEPRGLLVCGVQGCGKSLVTKAASQVFGIPLVRLDFAAVFAASSPELAMRQAMRISEAIAPLVLWVDEIEKGLAAGASEPTQARVFGDFLVWLQEKRAPVFVAATANEVEHLPPELVRRGRFDDVFFVDLPSAKEREEILAIHLRLRQRAPEQFDLATLAKSLEHFAGAELEQIVVSALFRAFSQKRDVRDDDLRAVASKTIPLATMYEEKVQALRNWAKSRARKASAERRTLELFEE